MKVHNQINAEIVPPDRHIDFTQKRSRTHHYHKKTLLLELEIVTQSSKKKGGGMSNKGAEIHISSEKDLKRALSRIEELWHSQKGTKEGEELERLITAVSNYEERQIFH
ncbi:hypothetical protein AB4298_07450 [Shewanella sp. 10N.261.52.F9]|uniref:hypothetical protein n=1 Tax=Shewanella sp. 10N.261.52.F9 TaxID=3229684 RepID=UPI00354DA463